MSVNLENVRRTMTGRNDDSAGEGSRRPNRLPSQKPWKAGNASDSAGRLREHLGEKLPASDKLSQEV